MQDKRQDTVRTAYSLKEASALMGITPEAVRKRLNRKTLEGYKDENENWQVYLPDKEQDSIRTNGRTPSGEVGALRAHIETLQATIENLRLESARKERTLENYRRDREQLNYLIETQERKLLEAPRPGIWQKLLGRR